MHAGAAAAGAGQRMGLPGAAGNGHRAVHLPGHAAAAAQGAHAAQAGVCSLLLLSQLCAIPKSIPCIIVLVHVTTMYTKPMLYAKNANALQRLCLVGRFGQAKDLHDDIGV